ncbi:MAG: peptidyl-prolyl cis-trans isomerase [Bacteroidetes bacterium]|nr:peptidyl-prolyl cis-trans isomerase [Bacteroidota bacterium]
MKIYHRIAYQYKYSFLLLIIYLGTSYPFQDSLKSQVPVSDLIFDEIVASIGSINITVEEFSNSYELGPAFVKRKTDSKSRYLKYMIYEKLLALDGYSRNLDKEEEITSLVKDFENDLATEEMFKDDILNKIEISEKEIDTVVTQKQLELDIRWLYAQNKDKKDDLLLELNIGTSFDSLYQLQFEDSIYLDDRSMKINRYQLGKKNPELAEIIDTLPVGQVSIPIEADDGWYIFKIHNVWQNIITTEAEMIRLRQESINSLKKKKMDKLSDDYVNKLLLQQNPIIKIQSFNVLRAYLGLYNLTKEKYDEWNLSEKLSKALDELNVTKENIGQTILIETNDGTILLEEFLVWYRNRSQYIKFNKTNLQSFSSSVESLVWRMVRDKLLAGQAYERNYHTTESFTKQAKWWKDKIVYSAVKKDIVESVELEEEEVKYNSLESLDVKSNEEKINTKITRQLFLKLNKLKSEYEININEDVLEKINVSEEHNPRAIDFYTVKKDGLIPRTPYPTIDFEWINWE